MITPPHPPSLSTPPPNATGRGTADPEVLGLFDELEAAGLVVSWVRPVGFGAGPAHYVVVPRSGAHTRAQLRLMARLAVDLVCDPERMARVEAFLSEFESSQVRR